MFGNQHGEKKQVKLVFSCLFEDKPQSYRSWNALCLCKIEYGHHFTVHMPSLAFPYQQQLPCERCSGGPCGLYRLFLNSHLSVVALCMCAMSGERPSQKSFLLAFSPCNSLENRRGLLSLFFGRKSLHFCDLKSLLKKFLAFKIWERTRFSAFI